MTIDSTLKTLVFNKVLQAKPHLSVIGANELTEKLINADERLLPNLIEWAQDKPLSSIWINDKYCIGAVLKIRGDSDFISAFLALNDYASDPSNEKYLWRARA